MSSLIKPSFNSLCLTNYLESEIYFILLTNLNFRAKKKQTQKLLYYTKQNEKLMKTFNVVEI